MKVKKMRDIKVGQDISGRKFLAKVVDDSTFESSLPEKASISALSADRVSETNHREIIKNTIDNNEVNDYFTGNECYVTKYQSFGPTHVLNNRHTNIIMNDKKTIEPKLSEYCMKTVCEIVNKKHVKIK